MVNWKSIDNIHRVVAVLIAANPNIKLDYTAMAALFGQGATYHSLEGQFRNYRKMADDIRAEAENQGIAAPDLPRGRNSVGTPRTPRGFRSGITKPPSSSSTVKSNKSISKPMTTPTKRGSQKMANLMDAIFIEDDEEFDNDDKINDTKVKRETVGILPSVEKPQCSILDLDGISSPANAAFQVKKEKLANNGYSIPQRSRVTRKVPVGDELMNTAQGAPDNERERGPSPDNLDVRLSGGSGGYGSDSTYGGTA